MKNLNLNTNLKEVYNKCNEKYFDGKLSNNVTVEWSGHMTKGAGKCTHIRKGEKRILKRIALGKNYHRINKSEILDTLIHEMIHAEFPKDGHGKKFLKRTKELNEQLGLSMGQYATYTEELVRPHRWNYQCIECGRNHRRKNRNNKYKNYTCKCKGNLKEIKI